MMISVKNIKKKWIIVAVALAGVVTLVGATVAYHSAKGTFNNLFHVMGKWQNTTTDEFISPDNWKSCEEVSKTVVGRNTGDVSASVRMKYEEYWKAANSVSTTHDNELPFIDNGVRVAVINLQNTEDWVDGGDGWYYYKYSLDPEDQTSSLLKSVTMNCDVNFAGANDVCTTANGATTCTKHDNQYDGAKYHVFVTMEYIEDRYAGDEWGHAPVGHKHYLQPIMAGRVNDLGDYTIDFTRGATVSDVVATANGNGINTYTENGKTIYYYRGNVDNNIVWHDFCWKIVRTTAAGGLKIMYNGSATATTNDGVTSYTCSASPSLPSNMYNYDSDDIGAGGYMYGQVVKASSKSAGSTTYTFSKHVNKIGDTYYLDTSANNYISGTWSNTRNSATSFHYFCTDGAASCVGTNLGYVYYYSNSSTIYYLSLNGYDNYEQLRDAVFANTNPSRMKTAVESWFSTNLASYEDELEDAVFCNDRTMTAGALKDENSPTYSSYGAIFGFYDRYNNTHIPTLDCSNKRDAFTKDDTENGNGLLEHKVGLITMDEMYMGDVISQYSSYPYAGRSYYTMTPYSITYIRASNAVVSNYGQMSSAVPSNSNYYRPTVVLKGLVEYEDGGKGTLANPYVVK